MLTNQPKKDERQDPKIAYTREFQIKNRQDKTKKSWRKIIIPLVIIFAVAIVTVAILLTLKLVKVQIGG